jgi:hypothetical protein
MNTAAPTPKGYATIDGSLHVDLRLRIRKAV